MHLASGSTARIGPTSASRPPERAWESAFRNVPLAWVATGYCSPVTSVPDPKSSLLSLLPPPRPAANSDASAASYEINA